MKKIICSSLLLVIFLSIFSTPLLAQTKTKSVVKLPTFVGGNSNVIDKPVVGDLMIAGGNNTISAVVTGNTFIAGGQIDINSTINGNLIVAGGKVNLNSQSVVTGYILVAGGKVSFQGKVLGPIKTAAGSLIIGDQAVISNNLDADVGQSEISSTAKITGTKNIKIHETKTPQISANTWRNLAVAHNIFSFLSKLIVLLIFVRLFGHFIKPLNSYTPSILSTMGWGLMVLIVTPILSLILITTLIGIPLSTIIFGSYFIALYSSEIVVSLIIGQKLAKNQYVQGLLGLSVLTLLGLIPFVGAFIKLVVLLLGLGIIFKLISEKN